MKLKDLASAYDSYHSNSSEHIKESLKFYSWILRFLNPKPGNNLLDVGCGKGIFLQAASQLALETSGIDISQIAINEARKNNPKSSLRVGPGEKLPYRDNLYEYVTCLGSLEHFKNPLKAVREISRVLKPKGTACIFLPNSYFVGHIYLVFRTGETPSECGQDFSEAFGTLKEWSRLLTSGGLTPIRIEKYNSVAASKKVNPILKHMYQFVLRPFVPLNLSYAFAFLCTKGDNPKTRV